MGCPCLCIKTMLYVTEIADPCWKAINVKLEFQQNKMHPCMVTDSWLIGFCFIGKETDNLSTSSFSYVCNTAWLSLKFSLFASFYPHFAKERQ